MFLCFLLFGGWGGGGVGGGRGSFFQKCFLSTQNFMGYQKRIDTCYLRSHPFPVEAIEISHYYASAHLNIIFKF